MLTPDEAVGDAVWLLAGYRSDLDSPTVTTPLSQAAATQPADGTTVIRVPRSIHDVDNGKILGFGADLAEDHPVGAGTQPMLGLQAGQQPTHPLHLSA
jgi:hypothetical protein